MRIGTSARVLVPVRGQNRDEIVSARARSNRHVDLIRRQSEAGPARDIVRLMGLGSSALSAGIAVLIVASPSPARAQVGRVAFPNSGSPAAQASFLAGLAQLHNFEYASAAELFRTAQQIDVGFALAYWGEAMTYNHAVWMEQDLGAARRVLDRLGPTSEARVAKGATARERGYLQAIEQLYGAGTKPARDIAYAAAMAEMHRSYPDDPDAAAFYALALLGTAHNGRDLAISMRAAAILEPVFHDHPDHPGAAHYLIHCYDDPIHAPLGLRAARVYATIAPSAGHAQHMTSHIFLALGMWDEVVAANEAGVRVVDQARVARGGIRVRAAITASGSSMATCSSAASPKRKRRSLSAMPRRARRPWSARPSRCSIPTTARWDRSRRCGCATCSIPRSGPPRLPAGRWRPTVNGARKWRSSSAPAMPPPAVQEWPTRCSRSSG